MTTHLLLAGTIAVVAAYFGTTDNKSTSYHDTIVQLRSEVAKTERQEHESRESRGHEFNRNSGGGRKFYVSNRKGTRESHVRKILQNMFRFKFKSIRPAWLTNPKTGRRLEIDCYCRELRLCVEIDGEQHNKYLPFYHGTYQKFLEMRERDVMKNIMIRQRGLKMVRIPFHVPDQQLEEYILVEVNKVMK